jgi:hypothetical protein
VKHLNLIITDMFLLGNKQRMDISMDIVSMRMIFEILKALLMPIPVNIVMKMRKAINREIKLDIKLDIVSRIGVIEMLKKLYLDKVSRLTVKFKCKRQFIQIGRY